MSKQDQMTKKEWFKKNIKTVEQQLKSSDLDPDTEADLEQRIDQLEQQLEEATKAERNRRDIVESIGSMTGLEEKDYMNVSDDSNASFRVSGLKKIEEVLKECEKRLNRS